MSKKEGAVEGKQNVPTLDGLLNTLSSENGVLQTTCVLGDVDELWKTARRSIPGETVVKTDTDNWRRGDEHMFRVAVPVEKLPDSDDVPGSTQVTAGLVLVQTSNMEDVAEQSADRELRRSVDSSDRRESLVIATPVQTLPTQEERIEGTVPVPETKKEVITATTPEPHVGELLDLTKATRTEGWSTDPMSKDLLNTHLKPAKESVSIPMAEQVVIKNILQRRNTVEKYEDMTIDMVLPDLDGTVRSVVVGEQFETSNSVRRTMHALEIGSPLDIEVYEVEMLETRGKMMVLRNIELIGLHNGLKESSNISNYPKQNLKGLTVKQMEVIQLEPQAKPATKPSKKNEVTKVHHAELLETPRPEPVIEASPMLNPNKSLVSVISTGTKRSAIMEEMEEIPGSIHEEPKVVFEDTEETEGNFEDKQTVSVTKPDINTEEKSTFEVETLKQRPTNFGIVVEEPSNISSNESVSSTRINDPPRVPVDSALIRAFALKNRRTYAPGNASNQSSGTGTNDSNTSVQKHKFWTKIFRIDSNTDTKGRRKS